jgi:chemotaxis protein MotA
MRIRMRGEQNIREMTLEGVSSILEGINPRMLEARLVSFFAELQRKQARPREGTINATQEARSTSR